MPSLFLVAFLVIASLQGTFGAPCAKDLGSCVSKCKAKTGWPNPMGNHTWAPPSSAVSSSYSGSTPAANLKGNPGYGNPSEPAPTSTSTTQPTPTSTPVVASSSNQDPSTPASNSSSSVSSADIAAYLSAHNTVRSQHGANALTWSDKLSSAAQTWANGCKFVHSGGQLGPFGENLAAGTGDGYGIPQAIKSWTDEAYNSSDPQPSHFTQVVWKSTTEVGCAVTDCAAGSIFTSNFGVAHYYVCEYSPAGNVIGEFAQNVQA